MNILQNILDKALQEAFSVENLLPQILQRKLKEKNIVLSDKQLKKLYDNIINSPTNSLEFEMDENKTKELPSDMDSQANKTVEIKIDAEEEISYIESKAANIVKKLFPQISTEIAKTILLSLKQKLKSHQRNNKNIHASFNKNLQQSWGKPIDLLEMLYFIAEEMGGNFNNHFRPLVTNKNNFVFNVLTRLHARGCQITSEIILLLRNGFADGAHARWRTLHEIAIVSYFIQTNGNDLAERYYFHTSVESYKAALQYQEHCEALGFDKFPLAELDIMKIKHDEIINRFGQSYKEPYGWASSTLGKRNPKFADIEKNVGLEFMRPYYKMASHNVHANPKGIFFKLGLAENENILLAGPSNLGLFDPGCNTAISMLQITSNLLTTMETNLDSLVSIQIMDILTSEIKESFDEAEHLLEEKPVV